MTVNIMNCLYDLSRGPFVWLSIAIFLCGSAAMTIRFYRLTHPLKSRTNLENFSFKTRFLKREAKKPSAKRIAVVQWLGNSVLASQPVLISVSILFHLLLFIVPLFLLAHNHLFERAVGLSLGSLPVPISDFLTSLFLICCLFFLSRRLFLKRVRAISSLSDYIILALVTIPFLTGYLAYHQIVDYKFIITVHMLAGEVMLVAAPFTKIFHMFFFFVGRFVLLNEHTLGSGSRKW